MVDGSLLSLNGPSVCLRIVDGVFVDLTDSKPPVLRRLVGVFMAVGGGLPAWNGLSLVKTVSVSGVRLKKPSSAGGSDLNDGVACLLRLTDRVKSASAPVSVSEGGG